jgi:hypothetical protein
MQAPCKKGGIGMSGTPESEHWPEPEDRPIRQSKVILYTTLCTALAGMLIMALFSGYMANEGFGILEEPGVTDNLQVLVGGLVGGVMGFIAASLLERAPDGNRKGDCLG